MLATVALLALAALAANAQEVGPGAYQVNYVSGAGGTIRLLNPGFGRTSPFDRAPLCANIYVYRPDEQLLACCSCPVTANGLRTINVAANLINNPLQPPLTTPANVGEFAIKIVSTVAGTSGCTNGAVGNAPPFPTAAGFATGALASPGGLVSWATHRQTAAAAIATGTPGPAVTETESQTVPLSAGELNALQQQCAFAAFLGTGAGICTCGPTPGPFSPEEAAALDGGAPLTKVKSN
jgi:hypothetical protein